MFWKLYRRSKNPDHLTSQPQTFEVTNGVDGSIWMSLYPGWWAFDFRTQVADEPDGGLGKGVFQLSVDGKVRVEYRASWPWTRHYMFLPQNKLGEHYSIHYDTNLYRPGDMAQIRYQNMQYFTPLTYIKAIEGVTPPKPLEELVAIDILSGYTRYQSTGPAGTEIPMTLVIKGTENWRDFMSSISDYYILQGNEGFYGGVILPQSVDQKKISGDVYLVTCTFHSPSQAGGGSF